ncbi:MAG TPA: sigma-70 family RNA polymerase sigma factor [Kiritimatiellia bacterium]|nr:sigma-70 family RNA polymerase sigma factor [Kiritimatiellia bacterium]
MDELERWIFEYRNGDLHALERAVEATRPPLYAFALRLTRHPDQAEDIVQETWLKAIRNLDRFHGGRFLSWLFRIAHNLVLDSLRKNKPILSIHQPLPGSTHTLEDSLPSRQPSPRDHAEESDLANRIQTAVERLHPDQQTVFTLRTEAGLTFREIASLLGIPLNTALARMHYAQNHLRKLLHSERLTP